MRRESYPNRSNPPDRTGPAARGYRSAALRILKSDCSPARRYALRVSGRFRSRLEMRLSAYRGTGPFPTRVFYGWPGGGVGRCRNGNRSGGDRVRLDLARQKEVAGLGAAELARAGARPRARRHQFDYAVDARHREDTLPNLGAQTLTTS